MLLIGLTGGIGSGKSTVAAMFHELGVPVIDADEIAHELTRPGTASTEEILRLLGPIIQDRKGGLDRARLRRLVFSDPARRRQLEALLHPRILSEMLRRATALDVPYCILSIPLLLESGQQTVVDRILVVDAPETLQKQRTMQRDGMSAGEVEAILQAQHPRKQRLAAADDVIVNDGDLDALRQQVEALHRKYLALAGAPPPFPKGGQGGI